MFHNVRPVDKSQSHSQSGPTDDIGASALV